MKLQRLYKKTKTGAIQVCDISTKGGTVFVSFGQLDGKMQEKFTLCKPKNVGKKNETTSEQQATLEALSKHAKKVKDGYVFTEDGEQVVFLPQKVKAYVGNEHKINFPAYSTPKLNGINGTYWLLPDGSLKLTSRGGDEYPAIPHLESNIKKVMEMLDTDCLNGELYIHGQHLQDITSAVKKPKELSKSLEFHVFELPNYGATYHQRNIIMKRAISLNSNFFEDENCNVPLIVGTKVDSAEDIEKEYEICMRLGLEGTVIYNAVSEYKFNERSSSVYKYKKTLDAEYNIVDCEVDKNGHPVFHCVTSSGAVFKVKPKGTDADRKQMVRDFESVFLNRWYKIEYETLSKDGKPLKPVGIGLRACNEKGEPIE